MSPFQGEYSRWYDTIYRKKDYPGECDFLESVFAGRSPRPHHVLDLGCGTGGHALNLARRGYQVTGVDRSATMLQEARRKAKQASITADFHEGDLSRLAWHEQFDAAIAMFAVTGYITSDREMEDYLSGVWRGLRPGGVFIFDGWFGPGVLNERPTSRLLEIPLAEGESLLRLAEPQLDMQQQTVEIHYRLWRQKGSQIVAEGEERHRMRFFFPRELRCLLRQAGFSEISLHPLGSQAGDLREHDWHFTAIATKGTDRQ